MMARLSAFVIWALVAGATVFWGMRLLVHARPAPANAVVVSEATPVHGDLSRLLGAEPVAVVAAAPQMSTRFRLLGVMAAKTGPQGVTPGVALISIDGKPARAFIAGATIEDQLVLQSVSLRSASIGPAEGATTFVLEIPPLPPPATGVLPSVTTDPTAAPPQPDMGQAPPPPAAGNPEPVYDLPPGMEPPGIR